MLVELFGRKVLAHGGEGALLLLPKVLQAERVQLAQHLLQQATAAKMPGQARQKVWVVWLGGSLRMCGTCVIARVAGRDELSSWPCTYRHSLQQSLLLCHTGARRQQALHASAQAVQQHLEMAGKDLQIFRRGGVERYGCSSCHQQLCY